MLHEHGIFTTDATWWVHLFPLTSWVYWYRVTDMRAHLKSGGVAETPGYSVDGTLSGSGFLVPRTSAFVRAAHVSRHHLGSLEWAGATDREAGVAGESLVRTLIDLGIVHFPPLVTSPARSHGDQMRAIDFWITPIGVPFGVEAKVERVKSQNLFVQSREGGHRPNLTPSGELRHSDLPALEEDHG